MNQPAQQIIGPGAPSIRPIATARQSTKKVNDAPPSTLLMGEPGAGKTHSIITALVAGLKVFVLSTEGNGIVTLRKAFNDARAKNPGLDLSNLHWATIAPVPVDLTMLLHKAQLSNRNTPGQLQGLTAGLEKQSFQQYTNLIRFMGEVTCERTGINFGNIAHLDDSWMFVLDSLTGLTTMVVQNVKGLRPGMTEPEIGIAQEHVRDTISILTSLSCFVTVTAHIDMKEDRQAGVDKIMVNTVGQKLAPQLVGPFSEVVLAYRTTGAGFWWTNDNEKAKLKHRLLPLSVKLAPDFKQLIEAYREDKELSKGGETPA